MFRKNQFIFFLYIYINEIKKSKRNLFRFETINIVRSKNINTINYCLYQ